MHQNYQFFHIKSTMSDDHDERTIHCGNLYADKITEDLLYELFLQVSIFQIFMESLNCVH